MKVDNGRRVRLIIPGVFDGWAGVQGNKASFIPNRLGSRPEAIKGGMLDGQPVLLWTTKEEGGRIYTARFEEIA